MDVRAITSSTLQAAGFAVLSSIIGQALTAYRSQEPFAVDWVALVQFALSGAIMAPVNYLWQDFLEKTWPSSTTPPSGGPPRFSLANLLIKMGLDQTVGAFVNSFMFLAIITYLRAGIVAPAHLTRRADSLQVLLSPKAYRFASVGSRIPLAVARANWYSLTSAGWRFWPFVSLFAFTTLRSVLARQLCLGLAGLAWGVHMSRVV